MILQKVVFNPLSANFTEWSNILKQFVAKLPTNCLSVSDHFVKLSIKGIWNTFCPHMKLRMTFEYTHVYMMEHFFPSSYLFSTPGGGFLFSKWSTRMEYTHVYMMKHFFPSSYLFSTPGGGILFSKSSLM